MKFIHGQLVYSASIHYRVAQEGDMAFAQFVNTCLFRHLSGDFGNISECDAAANVKAIEAGDERIFSAYISKELRLKIWVITAADRSSTTVLLPEEY